jgi:hypothetical protein
VVQNWLQIPILLLFECVVVGSSAHNLMQVFMQALMHEGGLMKYLIGKKLMTFDANGVFFFKALGQVLIGKFLMGGLHIPQGFITWLIEPIWQFRLYHICKW